MKTKLLHFTILVLGWMSFVFGAGLVAYAIYALWIGSVQFDTKFVRSTLTYAESPSSFVFAVVFYLVGGVTSIWCAKTLLID